MYLVLQTFRSEIPLLCYSAGGAPYRFSPFSPGHKRKPIPLIQPQTGTSQINSHQPLLPTSCKRRTSAAKHGKPTKRHKSIHIKLPPTPAGSGLTSWHKHIRTYTSRMGIATKTAIPSDTAQHIQYSFRLDLPEQSRHFRQQASQCFIFYPFHLRVQTSYCVYANGDQNSRSD